MIARWLLLRRWRRSLRIGQSVRYQKDGDYAYEIRLIEDGELTVWDADAMDYLSFPIKKAYPINQTTKL